MYGMASVYICVCVHRCVYVFVCACMHRLLKEGHGVMERLYVRYGSRVYIFVYMCAIICMDMYMH
jgi:hypothetical protein